MSSKGRLLAQAITESRVLSAALTETAESPSFPITKKYTNIDLLPSSGTIGDIAFVESTNRLYIWNGNGWYNIALINTNPSFDSGGAPESSYLLVENDSGYISSLTITLLATDPEGIPIQYSALLSDSASNFVTVSQDSSVFTITPKSVDSIEEFDSSGGAFSITFRASDGVNLATVLSAFTVDLTRLIVDSRYTTLMLKTTGVDAADNNTFVDGSTNNFAITRNGNTTQGAASPYGDKWSNYFDGIGDYIQTPTNAITIGTNDFTYEAWIYPTASPAWGQIIGAAYNFSGIALFYNLGTLNVYGSGSLLFWNGILQLNVWQHVALTRENGILYLYHNGIKYGTSAVNSYNLTNSQYRIGARIGDGELFTGYISDARIVNGTAVYTSNFTPPAEPLAAVTGTALLTCQSNRFKDSSVNNFTLTKSGDVRVTKFSPYDQFAYDASTLGGSAYLDGTGDYLVLPEVASTSGDVTIELWINPSKIQTYNGDGFIIGNNINGLGTWAISFAAPTNKIGVWLDGYGAVWFVSTATVNRESWNHIALVKTAGIIRLYINGIQESTTIPQSANFGQGSNVYIGQYHAGGQPYTGYVSDVRVVKGTAIYTSNFTPPIEPLTPVANTSLLCNFTNAGIYDASTKSVLEAVGSADVSTSISKFGNGSIDLTGSSSELILSTPDPSSVNFGSGDFTVETWVYPTGVNGGEDVIVALYEFQSDKRSWYIALDNAQLELRWSTAGTVATTVNSTNNPFTANQWHHVAMVRNGNTITGYVNGLSVVSATESGTLFFDPTGTVRIGRVGTATTSYLLGYIEDLRITKGLARYTTNFTPPSAPLEG